MNMQKSSTVEEKSEEHTYVCMDLVEGKAILDQSYIHDNKFRHHCHFHGKDLSLTWCHTSFAKIS